MFVHADWRKLAYFFFFQMNEAVQNVLRGTHFAPAYTCNCAKALASSYALLKETLPVLKGMVSGTVQPADASASLTAAPAQPSQAPPHCSATSQRLRQHGAVLRRVAPAQPQQANLDLSRQEAAKLQEAPGMVNAHDQWRMQQLLLYDV
ncbi:hypothetical protein DUNSADRAFT_6079 [Dunaliella salina]|uniref:Encoded protein n=1 Tax=Dunaliella salina TaxID=3046 RepID=A0ABQ7H6X8_DUNSA|nr:hypothetical protein DUNSADRAFT_6079 [Dunaliella salina]|eukprot:KAF5842610.1 hypothetical protein DUNSADRAFT_6079 [Dunaliella salina]